VNFKRRLNAPETEQFIKSYDSYYSLVFSTIYSKINNFHDAEDICQEVFIRFYNKMDEVENPRKWLYGCLRIVVLDYYKEKRHKDVDTDELFDDISLGYVNGFRDTRMMLKHAMDEILDKHGDRDASLFEMIAVYNYTFVEAARHLNLGYKQARYRYSRMAEMLMEKLREKGVERLEDLL